MHHTFASEDEFGGQPPVSRFLGPLSGWVLQPLIHLDRHRPGVLAEVANARSRKRQAIFAALAAGVLDRAEETAKALLGPSPSWHGAVWPALLGEALLTADPRAIVAAAYGVDPDGYLTLLSRAGPEPLRHTAYARLHTIYADPRQRRRGQVLSDTPKFNDAVLDLVEILPEEALRPVVINACRNLDDARIIAFCVGLALQRGRSRAEVAKQVSDMGPLSSHYGLVQALLRNFDASPNAPDLSAIPGAEVLTSPRALDQAGRDCEDCLGSPLIAWSTSMGEILYAVLHEQQLIVQLHALSTGWLLSAVHKPGNRVVLAKDRHIACALFEAAGFPVLTSLRRSDEAELVGRMMDGVRAQLAQELG